MYEIIEDYRECENENTRERIFKGFCSALWESKNKRRTFVRTIKFQVKKELLSTPIGQAFDTWSVVEYQGYKSMTSQTDWISLLRQKINNMYVRHCDKSVILAKEYLSLLSVPKSLYYQWLAGKQFTLDEICEKIDCSLSYAQEVKEKHRKQKMDISWADYKILIEGFLLKCFSRCLQDLPQSKYKINPKTDLFTEDNMYIRYFCKSIDGAFKKYQKTYYGVREHKKYKRCLDCGRLIESIGNRTMYCKDCSHERKKISNKKASKKYRNKVRENRKS